MEVLFLLVVGHFLCDYALQSEFLAKGKNPFNPIPGVPWWWPMTSHCALHSGAVFLSTGSLVLALFEFGTHFWIDREKCRGELTFTEDQISHLVVKLIIFAAHGATT